MVTKAVISNHSGTNNSSFSIGGKRGITIFQGNDKGAISFAETGDIFVNKDIGTCEIYSDGVWVELERKHEFQTVTTSTYDILPLSGYVGCAYIGGVSLFLPPISKNVEIRIKDQTGLCSITTPITIYPYGDDMIDGQNSLKLDKSYSSITLIYNNGWYAI